MNRFVLKLILLIFWVSLCSWGFYAHRLINRHAVFSLPLNLAQFYKEHLQYITENAVAADKRVYIDTAESPRHYIDLDALSVDHLDSIPIHWTQAKEKFTERLLLATGIIPWQIDRSYFLLTRAFQTKNLRSILRHSADLGHYIADAHVPLHTTKNYNGQMTGQRGIHAFWESRLPERFATEYDFFIGKAKYIESPLNEAWLIVKESHHLVDSVLALEKELDRTFRVDRKYAFVERGLIANKNYSEAYSVAYHTMLEGMVERRMRASIKQVANFWFSAWVDAGQPDLTDLLKSIVTLDTLATPLNNQKSLGRQEWH